MLPQLDNKLYHSTQKLNLSQGYFGLLMAFRKASKKGAGLWRTKVYNTVRKYSSFEILCPVLKITSTIALFIEHLPLKIKFIESEQQNMDQLKQYLRAKRHNGTAYLVTHL